MKVKIYIITRIYKFHSLVEIAKRRQRRRRDTLVKLYKWPKALEELRNVSYLPFFLLNKKIIFDIPIFHLERSMGIFLSNDFLLHDILTLNHMPIGINLKNQSFRPIDIIPVIQAQWDLLPLSSPVSPILATTVFTMQQTPTF